MYSPKPVQTRIQFILFAFLQRKTAIKIFLENKNNPDLPICDGFLLFTL